MENAISSIRSDQLNAFEMSVTEESGGRLNAFAKEPKMEVISQGSRYGNGSLIFLLVIRPNITIAPTNKNMRDPLPYLDP